VTKIQQRPNLQLLSNTLLHATILLQALVALIAFEQQHTPSAMAASTSRTYPSLPPKLILTSTKAYFSPSRTVKYLSALLDPSSDILAPLQAHSDKVRFVLIPDFLTIYPCSQILSTKYSLFTASENLSRDPEAEADPSTWPISLGAQNVYPNATYGAFTGEIVPAGIKSLGCTIVELNHAERRRYLGEDDVSAAQKARCVSELGLIPLVCIGELDKPDLRGPLSRSVGTAMSQLKPQIEAVLSAVPEDAPVIFAYEPVWAIGASEPAGVDYVGPVVQTIREAAHAVVSPAGSGAKRTGDVKVVYGGSAGPGLWSGKSNGGNGLGQYVDGLFLGRFAHEISGVKGVVDEVVESLGKR
jgi:triosephosphate isomerase (TIM)